MPTATKRRPAPSRRAPARKGRGRAPARRAPARRKVAREPRFAALREQLNAQFSAHKTDVVAVVLAVAGILTGLSIGVHFAGPFGRGVDASTGAVLGKGRYLLP